MVQEDCSYKKVIEFMNIEDNTSKDYLRLDKRFFFLLELCWISNTDTVVTSGLRISLMGNVC